MARPDFSVDTATPQSKFLPRPVDRLLSRFVPQSVLRMSRDLIWAPIRKQYGQLPVADAFSRTYRNQLWGRINGNEFFSGRGSLERFAAPYLQWLVKFIKDNRLTMVVDLGCGDFRIGQRICEATMVNYVGVDIVADLINYNDRQFGNDRIKFVCANIIEDELPKGDICLVRQVLQHLSNSEILSILANCAGYPYLLVTEGIYSGRKMTPNLDMHHGPDTRIAKRSGVLIDQQPFNLEAQTVLDIPCPEIAAYIRTSLITGK